MRNMALSPIEAKKLSQENLTQSDIDYFRTKYGKKFVRALRVVEERKVDKYEFKPSDSITWIVKGRARQYMVIPKIYCTCRSFYQEVVISRESSMCYHLLAQQIAEIRNQYEVVNSTDTARRKMYVDWRRTD
jgi:predicted nucleic acid-binding Zn finger protein